MVSPRCIQIRKTRHVLITVPPNEYDLLPNEDDQYPNEDEELVDQINGIEYICYNVTLPLTKFSQVLPCIDCKYILKIKSVNDPVVPALAFVNRNEVNEIYMENLAIDHLSLGAFSALDRLTVLDLSNNNISEISDGILNSLHHIEILDLSCNIIRHISLHFLTGPKYLKVLNFSSNSLSNFDGTFIYSVNPITIDLNFNSLTSITINNSITNSNYENIFLRDNKMHSILDIMSNTTILKLLDLGQNLISELPIYLNYSMSSLKDLLLDHNSISNIPQRFSEQFPFLITLNLSFNSLNRLEYGTFEHFQNLKILDLSHNKFKTIRRYIHFLRSLETLYLDDNELSTLDVDQLTRDLPLLKTIHLDKNYFSCEELLDIIHKFQLNNKTVARGKTRATSNIHSVACLEPNKELDLKRKLEDLLLNKLANSMGNDSQMYSYFNKDFKNSSFYKYLENLQKQNSLKFNETELVSYFNRDFKNSSFYQYLETFRNNKVPPTSFNKSFFDYFNGDFRNSSFVKYLEDLKSASYNLNDRFNKSLMFNFFNENFEDSHFYKYMESLKNWQNSPYANLNTSRTEKSMLQYTQKSNSYVGVLYFQSFLLFVLAFAMCFLVVHVLRSYYFPGKRTSHVNEDVALCET